MKFSSRQKLAISAIIAIVIVLKGILRVAIDFHQENFKFI